jgi:hypothetical protein
VRGLEGLVEALRAQPGTLGELAGAAAADDLADGAPDGAVGRAQAVAAGAPAGGADGADGPAQLVASGPRAAGAREHYELLFELIFEGSLLHYGEPRVVRPSDPDLGLLLGDQLYALGLTRLAELGDLDAVRELADVISLISQASLAGEPELARSIWRAGAAAIGWGGDLRHEQAKALAREGLPEAAAQLDGEAAARVAPRDGRPARSARGARKATGDA